MFDNKTIERLGYYVYALIHPDTNIPFYIGKGIGNNRIDAGDVIVVPIDVKQTRFLENLSYSTQIIYQLAVAAAAVNSF